MHVAFTYHVVMIIQLNQSKIKPHNLHGTQTIYNVNCVFYYNPIVMCNIMQLYFIFTTKSCLSQRLLISVVIGILFTLARLGFKAKRLLC